MEESFRSYHFSFVGSTTIDSVMNTLREKLLYYRITAPVASNSKEIFYDHTDKVLSGGGLILSKLYEGNKTSFNVRKFNQVKVLNHRSRKYFLFDCYPEDEPARFAPELAKAIVDSYSSPFSVDLESLIRQTEAIMEVEVTSQTYEIICGSGYRASLQYEISNFKDLLTGKKVSTKGVSLKTPIGDKEETKEILDVIDRSIKGLYLVNLSRFEIGDKLLHPAEDAILKNVQDEDEDEDDEGDDD